MNHRLIFLPVLFGAYLFDDIEFTGTDATESIELLAALTFNFEESSADAVPSASFKVVESVGSIHYLFLTK
jgi:hypothetical protein